MTNTTTNSFSAAMEELGNACMRAIRYCTNAITEMSWPGLAVTCVLLAVAITVVPLALTLFIMFMIVKLAYGAVRERAARGKATPYKPVDSQGE